MESYRTVRARGSDEMVINKSRFIGHAAPAKTEEEALAFLRDMRREFKDATHNCYAYVIGQNSGIMRYSDDGEPGGTAGLPMMEVLKARAVVNCITVVTRYYGGIQLGAGGLVRAYTRGCAIALDAAEIVTMHLSSRYWVEVVYPLWDKVRHYLAGAPVLIEATDYQTTVTATLLIRDRDADDVLAALTALTDGRAEMLLVETCFAAWADDS